MERRFPNRKRTEQTYFRDSWPALTTSYRLGLKVAKRSGIEQFFNFTG